jgi:DNA-binding response OmpR family regulator
MKILIIDDDQTVVSIWQTALKGEAFEVVTASTGKVGLEKAKAEKPSLILLDQIMPDMKGNDILRMLKDDPQTNTIPVAICSNYSENTLMQDAIQQGAADYIMKYQIEPQDLINKVKSLIKGETNQEPHPNP